MLSRRKNITVGLVYVPNGPNDSDILPCPSTYSRLNGSNTWQRYMLPLQNEVQYRLCDHTYTRSVEYERKNHLDSFMQSRMCRTVGTLQVRCKRLRVRERCMGTSQEISLKGKRRGILGSNEIGPQPTATCYTDWA